MFFSPPYPEIETSAERRKRELSAKAVCKECTVKAKCLQEALVNNDDGVRGGMTVPERRRLSTPIPYRRPNPISSDWQIIVSRPNLLNTTEMRLEQSLTSKNYYRVVRGSDVIATYFDEMEAWIGLHNASL